MLASKRGGLDIGRAIGVFALWVAYAAYPIVTPVLAQGPGSIWRNWIDVAWLVVALAACSWVLLRGRLSAPQSNANGGLAAVTLLIALALGKFGWSAVTGVDNWIVWLMEVKPVVYMLIVCIVIAGKGIPDRRDFRAPAAVLATLLVAELLIGSLTGQSGEGLRPVGSGEVNYDAFLLVLAIAIGWKSGEKAPRWLLILVCTGVLASMSRTGILALGAVFLVQDELSFGGKLAVLFLIVSAFAAVWVLRQGDGADIQDIDRVLMWRESVGIFGRGGIESLVGYPPGSPLPVSMSEALAPLWGQQSEIIGASGVYPFNFHSMHLRIAATWGMPIGLSLIAVLLWCAMGGVDVDGSRALAVAVLIFGTTMGVAYASNTALPALLAGSRVWADRAARRKGCRQFGLRRLSRSNRLRSV